jgi:hypothetical protein
VGSRHLLGKGVGVWFGFGVWGSGVEVGVEGLGFGIWGLESGVWGLALGVWSLGGLMRSA